MTAREAYCPMALQAKRVMPNLLYRKEHPVVLNRSNSPRHLLKTMIITKIRSRCKTSLQMELAHKRMA